MEWIFDKFRWLLENWGPPLHLLTPRPSRWHQALQVPQKHHLRSEVAKDSNDRVADSRGQDESVPRVYPAAMAAMGHPLSYRIAWGNGIFFSTRCVAEAAQDHGPPCKFVATIDPRNYIVPTCTNHCHGNKHQEIVIPRIVPRIVCNHTEDSLES